VKFAQIHGAFFKPCFIVERHHGEIQSYDVCDGLVSDTDGCWCKLIDLNERIFSDWVERDGHIYRIKLDKDSAMHYEEI
jgi:hypothetical protein